MDARWSPAVVIASGVSRRPRCVDSVRETAAALVNGWPTEKTRRRQYKAACSSTVRALEGDEVEVEACRQAFIAAAKEAGRFIREEESRG
jgi:Protein of unknown function (DUF982)